MVDKNVYDAVVIGAGQGGGPLASAMAKSGWRTVLIEREHIGGTCVNTGCTPTKTMVASARVAHLVRRAADFGVRAGDVTVDLETVRRRKRDIVKTFREGSTRRVEDTPGLDVLIGDAAFTGARELDVKLNDGGAVRINADRVVINTGARPLVPRLEGLENYEHLDSTSIMELDEVPGKLLVIGGGYVGLEFGQMFRRFGAKVSIIERGAQLLSNED
ncbi:MAG: FAD-dependent oxidoreductase, partial [bacterium]